MPNDTLLVQFKELGDTWEPKPHIGIGIDVKFSSELSRIQKDSNISGKDWIKCLQDFKEYFNSRSCKNPHRYYCCGLFQTKMLKEVNAAIDSHIRDAEEQVKKELKVGRSSFSGERSETRESRLNNSFVKMGLLFTATASMVITADAKKLQEEPEQTLLSGDTLMISGILFSQAIGATLDYVANYTKLPKIFGRTFLDMGSLFMGTLSTSSINLLLRRLGASRELSELNGLLLSPNLLVKEELNFSDFASFMGGLISIPVVRFGLSTIQISILLMVSSLSLSSRDALLRRIPRLAKVLEYYFGWQAKAIQTTLLAGVIDCSFGLSQYFKIDVTVIIGLISAQVARALIHYKRNQFFVGQFLHDILDVLAIRSVQDKFYQNKELSEFLYPIIWLVAHQSFILGARYFALRSYEAGQLQKFNLIIARANVGKAVKKATLSPLTNSFIQINSNHYLSVIPTENAMAIRIVRDTNQPLTTVDEMHKIDKTALLIRLGYQLKLMRSSITCAVAQGELSIKFDRDDNKPFTAENFKDAINLAMADFKSESDAKKDSVDKPEADTTSNTDAAKSPQRKLRKEKEPVIKGGKHAAAYQRYSMHAAANDSSASSAATATSTSRRSAPQNSY